jgi:hypothetical protein
MAAKAHQSRANIGSAISQPPACGELFSAAWQPLQSKVCNVDSWLNLNRMGKPQKGQRGRGASMSMRLVVKSDSLIDGKDEPHRGTL